MGSLNQERGHHMHLNQRFSVVLTLSLAVGFLGCAERKVEAPTARANHKGPGSAEG